MKKDGVLFQNTVAITIAVLELAVYLIAFLPALFFVSRGLSANGLLIQGLFMLAAFFGFQLTLIFTSALIARCLPYPPAGRYELHDPKLNSLWIREAMSSLCQRTFVRSFANFFPFPGYFYYRLLGTKIHPSSFLDYTAEIRNPSMISIGENSNIGAGAVLTGHVMDNTESYTLGRIVIGNRVMIGARVSIHPNVVIEDDAVVATSSIVNPGTHILRGEIWGGVPAKLIKKINLPQSVPLPHEIISIVGAGPCSAVAPTKLRRGESPRPGQETDRHSGESRNPENNKTVTLDPCLRRDDKKKEDKKNKK